MLQGLITGANNNDIINIDQKINSDAFMMEINREVSALEA
jgi:hypothetical protein